MASMPGSRKGSLAAAAGSGAVAWAQVHVALVALGTPADADQLELVLELVQRWCTENDDPRTSSHLHAGGTDRFEPLVALLERKDVARASPQAHLLALKAMKILARRQDVRLRCTQHVVDVAAAALQAESSVAGEAANCLANLCYEDHNAAALVRAGGARRLVELLNSAGSSASSSRSSSSSSASAGSDAHIAAAGALQTLSFNRDGRAALLKAGGPAAVLTRLASTHSFRASASGRGSRGTGGTGSSADGSAASTANANTDVAASTAADMASEGRLLQRLVGTLHNLSSGADGTAAIRQQGGIAVIVPLLRSVQQGVAAAAGGALQNMSREAAARADIRAHPDAVASLVELLAGPDTQVGACAHPSPLMRWAHMAGSWSVMRGTDLEAARYMLGGKSWDAGACASLVCHRVSGAAKQASGHPITYPSPFWTAPILAAMCSQPCHLLTACLPRFLCALPAISG